MFACAKPRVPVPAIDLRATGDTLQLSFVAIPEAASLPDGRWVIVAPGERQVAIADLATRKIIPIGGVKSAEYRQPFSIFRFGDSLYVGDWGLQRTTVWTPAGKLVGSVPAPSGLRGVLPEGRDAEGQFYLELAPRPGPDGSGNRDSAVVLRASADFSRVDTVARLAPIDLAKVTGDAGRRFERRVLSGKDCWGVLPDGTVWVARVYQNRVDWIARQGRVTPGAPLPDRVLTVTEADREVFLRQFPEELRATAEQLPFALVKPPFEAAHTAPDGNVWLEKSRAIGDSVRSYQVVNRLGVLVREVRHPGRGHVIALSGTMALVAEPFESGERLVTYRLP
ncbi:MAG: hypothetical protein ACREMO_12450 [Gemmatimonadales bacterium]